MHSHLDIRLKTRADCVQCADCPPERVCAWSCVQGANMEEIVAGAALMVAGKLGPLPPYIQPEVRAVEDDVFAMFNTAGW